MLCNGIETVCVALPFDEAHERLVTEVQRRDLKLFALFDHAATAEEVGIILRPTRVIVFGSPKVGAPMMDVYPLLAIELPLRVLVWQLEPDLTRISYIHPEALAERIGFDATAAGPLGVPARIVADAFAGHIVPEGEPA